MQIIHEINAVREMIQCAQQNHKKIALVPTMGNLHAGHLALVKRAKELADYVVISIFVNPLQFAPHEDFASYPRTLKEDSEKLANLNIDLLFAPSISEMYPMGKENHTQIYVPALSDEFCGKSRPGFFHGVATVVTKLFNIVTPDIAIFGEKDYQQLLVIKKLVFDLQLPIEIQSIPIVRDKDNLALSSRNQYLSPEERELAPFLYAVLNKTGEKIKQGNKDFSALEKEVQKSLINAGFKFDYCGIRSADNLQAITADTQHIIILAAAWLNKTRLIDNVLVKI
jgi:pantoate--beta-alanine ligase